jgi:hypothetical protein
MKKPFLFSFGLYLFGISCLGLVIFFSWGFCSSAFLMAGESPISRPSELQIVMLEKKRRKSIVSALQEAKFYLLNGNIPKSKRLFEKVREDSLFSRIMASEHLALIAFLENRFDDAIKILEVKELKSDQHYKKYCVFKIMNLVFAKKRYNFLTELKKCKELNLNSGLQKNYLWLESLLHITLDQSTDYVVNMWDDLTKEPHKIDPVTLRILLKLILYTNQESLIKLILYNLSQESLEEPDVRELLGFIFYRLKDPQLAISFIEDISTPNAENIKGNIQLQKKAYEIAFGHFQLALQKKQNSLNAVERALPLAWKLQKWQEGFQLVSMIKSRDTLEKEKKALTSMFLTMSNEHEKVAIILADLIEKFQGQLPFEVAQIKTYNALQLGQTEDLKKYALSSCIQWDGMSCWILYQVHLWENFPKTLKRQDYILEKSDLTIESLKASSDLDPIVEEVFINQKDIEEMDQDSFQLKF